ncbi:MAG: FtsQ-type POTRA domain-containing protein [Verrucomicrobiota bacterium]|jgi:hypothetical protein|nr:FtsQ-type POTRA domain-containing protein [Verrucomicrobiota bacterium]
MFTNLRQSPFNPGQNPEDIGLGCQRRERRRRTIGQCIRFVGYTGSLLLSIWMLQGGIQLFLENYVWTNQSLALKRFQVRSQGVIPQHLLIQWTGMRAGDNLLSFHLADVKRNLELSPFVAEAAVERVFPETLSIHVRERKPKARIQLLQLERSPDATLKLMPLLLDEEGVIMSMPNQGEVPVALRLRWRQLPEIIGITGLRLRVGHRVTEPRLAAAVQWVVAFEKSILKDTIGIATISISEKDQLCVITEDGQQVLFGYENVESQLSKWMQIMDFGRQIGRRLAFLNLTIPNNMPFEWVPEEALQADKHPHRTQPPSLNHVDV